MFIDLHENAKSHFGNNFGIDNDAPLMIDFRLESQHANM